jgi:quercetin 2,3-dioxygenase
MRRSVSHRSSAQPVLEGAGVPVHRMFPVPGLDHVDPFLLIDHMGPFDVEPGKVKGFPDHPHRGFETVTYMLEGAFDHADSAGNRGSIEPGGAQWMTAGDGLLHSEMPGRRLVEEGGTLEGVQIWVNLPKTHKRAAPRYQDVRPDDIPTVEVPGGTVRVVSGEAFGASGPASTHSPVQFLHITLEPGASVTVPAPPEHNALSVRLRGHDADTLEVFADDGDEIEIDGGDEGTDLFVLIAEPLREPIARAGPFVMNTRDELIEAFDDYEHGRLGRIPAEHA